MKNLVTTFLLIGFINTIFGYSVDSFFKATVNGNSVDYSFIKKEKQGELNGLIDSLNAKTIALPSKATYINLYNLLVIKQVVNNYPIESPTSIPGFFKLNKFKVGKNQITLNHLENKIIRQTYNDPRIHFALVCGAKSCPPIQNFAYNDIALEAQLNIVTKTAMSNPDFIKLKENGSASISEIFKWYITDFGGNNKSIIKFINKYRENNDIVSISYYPYDWRLNDFKVSSSNSNVATYTPSALLRKGQFEIQFFNNLYTQNAWFNDQEERTVLGVRGSWNTLIMTFNYGVSKSNRFNLGLDVNLRSTRNSPENESAIGIFKFEHNSQNRTTISALGPKIKWNPFKSVPKLSLQSALWIPVAKELEGIPWLDWQRYTSWTQFFFDKPIGSQFQLFTELDLLFRMPEIGSKLGLSQTVFSTPASVFFSYFPSQKSTLYTQIQYAPTLSSFPSYYTQVGIGGKYQLFSQLQVEASYTNFFAGHTQGAGATFNLGLRYISK